MSGPYRTAPVAPEPSPVTFWDRLRCTFKGHDMVMEVDSSNIHDGHYHSNSARITCKRCQEVLKVPGMTLREMDLSLGETFKLLDVWRSFNFKNELRDELAGTS